MTTSTPMFKTLSVPEERRAGDTSPAIVCHKVFDSICVLSSGDMVCWCADVNAQRVYGNVHTDRIADVFNGEKYEEMRNWLLRSAPGIWCPAINNNCSFRTVPETALGIGERKIKQLQLEATSHCNLKCPACFVETTFKDDPRLREVRGKKTLSYDTMIDIVNQLPDLETIHYYNYGEPFINKDTIPFLTELKKRRPKIHVAVSTNGTVLTPTQIVAIAKDALVNELIFSIDGATQESYARYRVGGSFSKAFAKMEELANACRKAGTLSKYSRRDPAKVHITWQYILFEWNDSDEELELARKMARDIDLPILWIVTSGYGASKRFLPGSDLILGLNLPPDFIVHQAAQSQIESYLAEEAASANSISSAIPISGELHRIPIEQVAGGAESETGDSSVWTWLRQALQKSIRAEPSRDKPRYDARFACDQSEIVAQAKETIFFSLNVSNLSGVSWDNEALTNRLRLGIALRDLKGGLITELGGAALPVEGTRAGGIGVSTFSVQLPDIRGSYQLLFDFVHEHVDWFSNCGSKPLLLKVDLGDG